MSANGGPDHYDTVEAAEPVVAVRRMDIQDDDEVSDLLADYRRSFGVTLRISE